MRQLGTEQKKFLEAATNRYQWELEQSGSVFSTSAYEFLAGRGLDDHTARYRLGVVAEPQPGHEQMAGRLAIPYLTPAGVVDIKFRCIAEHDCKEAKCRKYLCVTDGGNRLYNARAVLAAVDRVVLCEGEFDAMAVSALAGVPAVGYPGTDSWHQKAAAHWPRVFAGLAVVVVADGDQPGIKAAKAVAKTLETARVVVMPDGEDSNSMLVKEGSDAFKERIGI